MEDIASGMARRLAIDDDEDLKVVTLEDVVGFEPVRGKHGGAAGGAWARARARAEQGMAWLGAAEVMQEVDTQQRRCGAWAKRGLGEPAVQRRHNGDGDQRVVEWVAGKPERLGKKMELR
ncbi:hypothetical protein M0R45_018404 [Rubus argutus]|uniref:Uncharacterized protein n=1 Tax=Rubus argutus TaxID=59490 RepID=A0AAW1X512_RUBAR